MSTQRVIVTHRRAHPVWAFIGVCALLGLVVHFWYVLLGVGAIVVAVRAERRRRFAAEITARAEHNRLRTRDYHRHKALTDDDLAWLRSHGWTG